jgi:hypothetical protein
MKSIIIDKDNFDSFIENYDWSLLSDSDDGLFPKPFMFTPQIMASIFNQFHTLFIFDNDTIWGSYKNDQLLLVAKANGVFSKTVNVLELNKSA